MERVCSTCQIKKSLDLFGWENKAKNKRRYRCKECSRKKAAEYHANHRDERNRKAREWRQENPERDRNYSRKYRMSAPWKMMLQHAKKRAAKFGWSYDLDKHAEKIKARVEKMKCEMTGIDLVPGVGAGSQGKRFYNTPSLDRIDANKGYVYSNIRIVCWAMNCAMGTWGEQVLRDLMQHWMEQT